MKKMEIGFDEKNLKATIKMVENKLAVKNPANIKLDNGKDLLIAKNPDGYTLYDGCELIVGDTTIQYVALAIIEFSWEAPIIMKDAKKLYKVEDIKKMLESSHTAIIKGLIAIYNKQTEDEKREDQTKHSNGIGFSGCDAKILGNMAKYAIAKGGLTEKQLAYVKKKIFKYAGQLTKIANKEI